MSMKTPTEDTPVSDRKWTKGPWLYRGKSDSVHEASVTHPYGDQVFRLHVGYNDEEAPSEANLNLLLAAPDLYEWAKALADAVRDETEALRNFKGADGAGMADCKIAESRVTECLARMDEVLARVGGG